MSRIRSSPPAPPASSAFGGLLPRLGPWEPRASAAPVAPTASGPEALPTEDLTCEGNCWVGRTWGDPCPPFSARVPSKRWGVLAAEVLLGRKSGPGYPNFTEMKGEGRGSPAGLPAGKAPRGPGGLRGLVAVLSRLEEQRGGGLGEGGPAATLP